MRTVEHEDELVLGRAGEDVLGVEDWEFGVDMGFVEMWQKLVEVVDVGGDWLLWLGGGLLGDDLEAVVPAILIYFSDGIFSDVDIAEESAVLGVRGVDNVTCLLV